MLRFIFGFTFVIFAIVLYYSIPEVLIVPILPSNQYWGPGKPRKVDESIRPFKINVSDEIIDDLEIRLHRTGPLLRPLEGVGWTYGMNTICLEIVLEYWRTKYDWTKRQALLNQYPQFKTNIQGLDIHFYHVKPKIPKRKTMRILPLLLVHSWPGSIVQFQNLIPLLTTPRSDRDFVFELIVPSLPGYGFSDAAVRPGLGNVQTAAILKILMNRVGFEKFYVQGGDWGSLISTNIGVLYPDSIIGMHLNACFNTAPTTIVWAILETYVPPLADSRRVPKAYLPNIYWTRIVEEMGYLHIQATKPDTVGIALTDSPAGLAAYILEKFSTWSNGDNRFKKDGNLVDKFDIDQLLDNIMVYWVTNTITTSMRLYAETYNKTQDDLNANAIPIDMPTACALFPYEVIHQKESILRRKYTNMIQMNYQPDGGHFAAMEEPRLLAKDFWSFVTTVEAQKAAEKTGNKHEF